MPGLRKRNSNRPSPTPHIKHRLTRLERQQLHKIPGIRSSLKRPKMPGSFVPLKRVISPMPSSLQAHPFIIPIHGKQLRTNQIISHGPSPLQQKAAPPKKKSRNQHISERTVPTPNHRISQGGQKRSDCQRDRTQPRSRCAGAPLPGGRHIRSIASSARAGEHLMCSPCESGLSEQATLYACRRAAGLLARIPS